MATAAAAAAGEMRSCFGNEAPAAIAEAVAAPTTPPRPVRGVPVQLLGGREGGVTIRDDGWSGTGYKVDGDSPAERLGIDGDCCSGPGGVGDVERTVAT